MRPASRLGYPWEASLPCSQPTRKARTQVCFPLVVSEEAIEAIGDASERYGLDPQRVAAKIVEGLSISPVGLRKIVAAIAEDEGLAVRQAKLTRSSRCKSGLGRE